MELTSEDEYRDLRRTTLNAHYTHARYAELIWNALTRLGFSGGRVLEPGCGSGNFIGLAPDRAQMTGIERDPVTAAIAAALYPQADIRAESFADTRIRAGYFDAAVGNVPFGKFKLSDPAHNPGRRLSIHNHFIVKALALTRPGGMAALLTSRYTMDSRNPEARRQIAGLADLVAAIRLPTSAHREAAGTDVVTDLLILRRRDPGTPAEPEGWALAPEIHLPGGQARVNEYFSAHPEFVLGEMRVGRGARNEQDLIVASPPDTAADLVAALDTAVTRANERGLPMTERSEATEPVPLSPLAPLAPEGDQIEGLIEAHPDGTFTRLAATDSDLATLTAQPYRPPATQASELRQLLGLRNTVLALLRAEAATPDDSEEITRLRTRLNTGYGDYLAKYGPVKRFTWSASGRTDPATGEKKQIRRRPPQGGFRNDPLYPLVYALEESYDPASRTAVRADIFSQRVVVPEPPLLGADTADEALAICLNNHGEVRLAEITRLLGADSDAHARSELGSLVYDEPGTGRLVWAPLYLSGDVRAKLAAATDAAVSDPRFEENVRALRDVIPRDLGPAEIEAQLGAGWIAPEHVQQFLRETLGDDTVTVERTRGRKWRVSGGNRTSVLATSTWGTGDICAHDAAQRLLTGTAEQILVQYKASDGTKVVDHQATEAARQKARDLADRFSIWVWEDTGRARDLSRVYNDRYNAVVPVSFDNLRLFTPGLSAALTLRKHQPPAIARIIYQGSAGLVHDTGAGKTLETIIGVRERQRLGLSHKPAFVVQKHKLGDFRDEFLRAYPGARLLVADTDDLTGNKRREFIARCATGNPAAIIMSREAFRSIPVSAERIAAFLKDEERALEHAVEDAQNSGEDNRTIKQIEAELLNTRERRKEQVAKIGQDRGLCYEDTGIDYVVVDEARGYRKGPIVSSLPGMADPGSARALDLLLKLGYHKELYGETRVCLADATPFTNRISEIYTWLRYLNPDIEDFDSWVRTFGKMATAYEMTPGGDFKAKARLREIINAVDLHLWLRELTDFKLKDGLDLNLPVMTGGRPEIVQVPASDELLAYADEIAWRYEHLPKGPPEKGEDNHLKIQGDAIKSALDLRLVGRSTSQPQKAGVTADVVFQKWLKHRDDVYHREDGSEHPVRGSLILVFASLGTPGRTRKRAEGQDPGRFDQWDFYTELRTQLAARGMPSGLIRFIHEAGNAQQKEELYRACRNGEVAVLLGSTEKLGTGTNVQDRAVGLVQVTAPWNWDEPHQELGRVERQGNQNTEFFCIRVVTSPSADAIKWERARQKEHSFRTLMSGRIEGRTIRIPDDDLTAAEMMAAASGDPRLLERAELEGTISRLHTLRRAWAQNQTALGYTISSAEQQIAGEKQAIAKIDAALRHRKDTRGDAFAMTVDGQRFTKRADAAERLRKLLRQRIAIIPRGHTQEHVALGEIGGFTLTATLAPHFAASIVLNLEGIPDLPAPLWLDHRELPEKSGIIARLENRLVGLEQVRADAEAAIEQLTSEIEAARESVGGSFPQQDEYDQARARLDALEAELVGHPKHDADAAEPGPAETAGSGSTQRPERATHDHRPGRRDSSGTASRPPAAASPQPASPGTQRMPADSPAPAVATPADMQAPHGERPVPAQSPPAAAVEPAHGPVGGLTIEHHQQGTLVHGTEKDDLELRRLLHEHGFRWSRTLTAWYLPRRWAFSTRGRRVTSLTGRLQQAHRSFTQRDQPPAPAASVPANAPGTDVPAAATTPGATQSPARNPAAAPADAGRRAAAVKASKASTALENGDYEQALALLDEAELLCPGRGVHWGAARQQVHDAANRTQAQQQTGPESPALPAGTDARTDDVSPGAPIPGRRAQADGPAATAKQPSDHDAPGRPHDEVDAGHQPTDADTTPGQEDRAAAPHTIPAAPAMPSTHGPTAGTQPTPTPDTGTSATTGQPAPGSGDEAPIGRPGQEARRPADDPAEPDQPPPVPAKASPGASGNPLTSDDIFLGLRRLPVLGFADLISAMGDGQPLDSLAYHLQPRSGARAADEPDTGAQETVTCIPQGVRIQVAAHSGTRAGLLAWPEVADWLRPGLSPGRWQIIKQAAQTRLRLITVNASFRAIGETDLAASAELELRDLLSAAVSAALEAARSTSAGKPAPGGQQSLSADGEAAALERIGHLASALPAWPPRWQKPVSQVRPGDIVGHPGYKLQPFQVSAQPRHHDGVIEITGRLTGPGEGEPGGEITWTMTINGQADPPVHVVPVPARSLRPGSPGDAEPAAGQRSLTQDSSCGPSRDDPHRERRAAGGPHLPGSAGATGAPTAGNARAGAPNPISGDGMGIRQPHSGSSATEEEDTMPPAPVAEPVPATETPATAAPGPAQAGPAAREDSAGARAVEAPVEGADEEIQLVRQLDDVLTAIIEYRRANASGTASAGADFADIRAAFAGLRNALELPAYGSQPRPGSPVPGPAPVQPPPSTATARHDRPAPEADDFDDIRAAFTALKQALDLPAHGRRTRAPGPLASTPDAASERLLDQAAAEAQACAQWYRDTPEWQRITMISRAARDLITAIRQASGEYWSEIRRDIRVRGFVRTVAARASLAVSGAAHILAGRLEKSGHKDTRIWRAAWGLHRSTATFADRVMRYTPPRSPDRMGEVRQIIDGLGQRPRHFGRPGPSRAADPRSRRAGATSAVALGEEGFPLLVSPTTVGQAAAPAARVPRPGSGLDFGSSAASRLGDRRRRVS